MRHSMSFVFLPLVLCSLQAWSVAEAASLPGSVNRTEENQALAKTADDSFGDVFDDIRWFFERLSIFCDMTEKIIPTPKAAIEPPQPSVGLTLQNGFRHFLVGVREISRSIVRVLTDKEVHEYKQLSRATDLASDMVKSVGEFFRSIRILVGNMFATYTFYVPEVLLTKCMGSYLLLTYPDRPFYEYPILLINDIIETFRSSGGDDNDHISTTTQPSLRKLDSESELFGKNVEQNEILDEDMYQFHNTPISPSPELAIKTEPVPGKSESVVKTSVDSLTDGALMEIPSWKKCVQKYATETIFRKLEIYFLKVD